MNNYFRFKQFLINQDKCAMKVSTDSCLFGAWITGKEQQPAHVLDIGAGSGLLMLMLAQHFHCPIEGIEIDELCFGQAIENLESSPWHSRLKIILGDARQYSFERNYDLIISNPPFYEKQLKADSDQVNAARHSTSLTLEELFQLVQTILSPGGKFAILIPHYRTDETISIAKTVGLFPHHYTSVRHSTSHPWYRTMIIFSSLPANITFEDIDVHEGQDNYSPAFIALLKDYYLFL